MKALAALLVLAAGCAAGAMPSVPDSSDPGPAIVDLELTTISSLPTVFAPARTATPPLPQAMWIDVSRIELASKAGVWTTISSEPMRFDALAFGGGASLTLGEALVPAGIYREIRITIDSATYVVGSTAQPVEMGSGVAAIALDNAVGPDTAYDVLLGFDVAGSLWPTDTGYAMSPHLDVQAIVAE